MRKTIKGGVAHVEAAIALCGQRRVAIDGGAHVGEMVELMREHFHQVHAFEPGSAVLPALRERVADWPDVILHTTALGDRSARVWFGHSGKKISTRSWFADPDRPGDVEMVMLDGLGLRDVDLIKLDLEGGELRALRGARETIRRCRPVIVLETLRKVYKRMGAGHEEAIAAFFASMKYHEARCFVNDVVMTP